MRKLLIPLIITLLSLIGNNCFAQTFSGGSGTIGNPYLISDADDLNELAIYVNRNNEWVWINNNWVRVQQNSFSGKYFVMTANITVNTFTPIGTGYYRNFQGNFDGKGYTISALSTPSSVTYGGLFGYIYGATIENVKIGGGSNIGSGSYVGALVGYAVNSTIDSCNTIVTPNGSSGCRLGGLIGYAEGCTISNCSNTATSTVNSSNSYYGGLVGYAENTTFNSCFSTASMSGNNGSKIGGLIGYATNNCKINECYSTATFSNINGYIGGLIGHSIGSQIYKSYSTPSLTRSDNGNRIGGLVGSADNTTINNCYSRVSFSNMNGSGYTGGLIGYIDNGSTISNSYSVPSGLGTITNSGNLYGFCYSNPNCFTNSYYLSGGNTQTYGIPKSSIDMQTMQFAIDLNACQTNIWRGFTNNYPVLYWQGTGTNLPSCFDGVGTEEDPIRIRCASDLIRISNIVRGGSTFSGQYLLVENDISFINGGIDSSQYFNPIGDSINSFRGNFNGGGHVISNLQITSPNTDHVGLFGYTLGATLISIGIDNTCSFYSNYKGGGLIGYAVNSTINYCYSLATLTGYCSGSSGPSTVIGGLIGWAKGCSIDNCYARSSIINGGGSGTNNAFFGGLIGAIQDNSTLSNSYSAPISVATSVSNRGSLVGYNNNNNISNTYYCSNVANMNINAGDSRSLNQMRQEAFAVLLNPNSQCSNQIWEWTNGDTSINNGLPVLYWQGIGTPLPSVFLDGAGTISDPFLIRTVADMIKLSDCVNGGTPFTGMYFRLENNIVFNGSSDGFNPIGYSSSRSFQGIFNGGGHVISNLTINSGTYVGLFGYISGATIDSLGIENFTLTSSDYLGGLVAYAINSIIRNSFSVSSLTGSWNNNNIYLGGLMGYSNSCTISNCYSRATINCSYSNYDWNYSGGLIGCIENGSISDSYSAPLSISYGDYGGSLVGYINNNPIFNNSYYLNLSGMNINYGILKDSNQMRSGCFVVTLNNSQDPVVWFKAKSQVNLGYPVLSWQKLSDNITPAGFEGNCLVTNDGSPTNPYQVKYVKDLIYISNMVANDTNYSSKYFQMLNDINFNNGVIDSSSLYKPIGDFSNNKPFSGNFNGLRNAIANYSFLDTTKNNIGFFGYTNLATIQRLGISNINICAKDTVGGLVANANSTKIGGCFVYGFIKGKNNVGGLVGYGTGTTSTSVIDTSFTNTSIDALTNVGGLVGNHNGGTINNSYSNSEIYSSIAPNNYVGGIIGRASSSNLTNVYSACKIIRNGTNTNFGKIIGNNIGNNTNCYSRDSVFVNYTNANLTGYTAYSNDTLRSATFATSTLGSANWKADYTDRINDGYPILKYQPSAVKPNSSGLWPTTTASQVVIIKSGVQLKANTANFPKCAYVKIENGGELNNTTNINLFGEYNRELYAGKWNLIGLSTYNQTLASLYNYADTSFKTFVKEFDYTTNNWSTTTTQGVNTKFEIGEGILVMPNYSLDDQKTIKTRIISKGVLFNEQNYQVPNPTTLAGRFVSLANNYTANLTAASFLTTNTSLVQGNIVYVYDSDSGKWNNNLQSINPINIIKPSEGFFIAASSIGGNFLFDKSTSGAKNTIKSDLIYVKAIANDNVRESFLEFNEEADNGFDFEDGLMLFGNNYNSVEPFFTIPTPEINDSTTQLIKDAFSSLPYTTELDLRSQKTNEVTLNFSNIPSNIHVYLLDSLLNKAQYLNEEPNYNLQVNEGDNAKRLYVLFSYNKEDKNSFFKPEMPQEIRIWNYNNNLNIEGKDLIRYEIYDVLGNKLLEEEILEDKHKIQLDLGKGIYIVRAYSKTGLKIIKIVIDR